MPLASWFVLAFLYSLSYAAPTITSISGCTGGTATAAVGCKHGTKITITGTGFDSDAQVTFTGGNAGTGAPAGYTQCVKTCTTCVNPVVFPATTIYCAVKAWTTVSGTWTVTVTQASGSVSGATAVLASTDDTYPTNFGGRYCYTDTARSVPPLPNVRTIPPWAEANNTPFSLLQKDSYYCQNGETVTIQGVNFAYELPDTNVVSFESFLGDAHQPGCTVGFTVVSTAVINCKLDYPPQLKGGFRIVVTVGGYAYVPSPTQWAVRLMAYSLTPSTTATFTATPSPTSTITLTHTITPTPTPTPSPTETTTSTATTTPTPTVTKTSSVTKTSTVTTTTTTSATTTASTTPTPTPTGTGTETTTNTKTMSASATGTGTHTPTVTPTGTTTTTNTETKSTTNTGTHTPTPTTTKTSTVTKTTTNTLTGTRSVTGTHSMTPTSTVTSTITVIPTHTPTPTTTESATGSPTPTSTGTGTSTYTHTSVPHWSEVVMSVFTVPPDFFDIHKKADLIRALTEYLRLPNIGNIEMVDVDHHRDEQNHVISGYSEVSWRIIWLGRGRLDESAYMLARALFDPAWSGRVMSGNKPITVTGYEEALELQELPVVRGSTKEKPERIVNKCRSCSTVHLPAPHTMPYTCEFTVGGVVKPASSWSLDLMTDCEMEHYISKTEPYRFI